MRAIPGTYQDITAGSASSTVDLGEDATKTGVHVVIVCEGEGMHWRLNGSTPGTSATTADPKVPAGATDPQPTKTHRYFTCIRPGSTDVDFYVYLAQGSVGRNG